VQRKVRIGIDLDSTVARIDRPWLAKLNAIRGTAYRPEDWSDWDLHFLQPGDREIFLRLFTPDLYDSVDPYPGAAEAIARLAKDASTELVCVTTNPQARSDEFVGAKRRWLQRYIPDLANTLIIASSKSGLGLDILIDDAPHHHDRGDYISVLIDRPWNEAVNANFRFKEWPEGEALVRTLIQEIAAGKYEQQRCIS
jgi:5'(3')-deoxyribonucleotidase